jgi:hypothetical protein
MSNGLGHGGHRGSPHIDSTTARGARPRPHRLIRALFAPLLLLPSTATCGSRQIPLGVQLRIGCRFHGRLPARLPDHGKDGTMQFL